MVPLKRILVLAITALLLVGSACEGESASSGSGGTGGMKAADAMVSDRYDAASGTSASGGRVSETPASGEPICEDAPSQVPDAGEDRCLACLIGQCCENARTFACFATNSACYDGAFGRIRECFALEATDELGKESWYIAAECADQVLAPADQWEDAGPEPSQIGSFPFDNSPSGQLLECAVGTRPESADEHDVTGNGGRPLYPVFLSYSDESDEDAGFYRQDIPFPIANCAHECLEGWR